MRKKVSARLRGALYGGACRSGPKHTPLQGSAEMAHDPIPPTSSTTNGLGGQTPVLTRFLRSAKKRLHFFSQGFPSVLRVFMLQSKGAWQFVGRLGSTTMRKHFLMPWWISSVLSTLFTAPYLACCIGCVYSCGSLWRGRSVLNPLDIVVIGLGNAIGELLSISNIQREGARVCPLVNLGVAVGETESASPFMIVPGPILPCV